MGSKNQRQLKRRVKRQQARQHEKASNRSPLVEMPGDPRVTVPRVDFNGMLRNIAAGNEMVWDDLIAYLHYFEINHYRCLATEPTKRIDAFLHCYFTALMKEDFFPEPQKAARLIQLSHILHHLTAWSSFQTTDAYLHAVIPMENNVPKIMALMNPRCEIQLDQSKLFDAHPYLASLWFMHYMLSLSSPTELMHKNMFRHLACMDERFSPPHHSLSSLYFGCTYHNPLAVRRVKGIINKGIKDRDLPTFENNPDPKSIAIVTERWHRNHAVYKSAGPLVEQLKDKYNLTLVWTNPPDKMPPNIVDDYFDKVVHCYFEPTGELVIPEEVKSNNFQMVYYPDIGMSDESIWMSCMRIAPIQAAGYGHPDTTGDGSEIDYFIGGDVEKGADDAYSETLVLLPGLAQEPAWPTAERQNNFVDDGVVRINCPWGPDKYNYPLLKMLADINEAVSRVDSEPTHEFHFFGSPGMNRYGALPSFIREVVKLLPNAHIHTEWEYYDYMREAEKNSFSLNSFPFGCYNVLIESLWMGLPFLTLIGDRFYNRAGMYLNNRIGMDHNSFIDRRALVSRAAQLITDRDMLAAQRQHLADLDLRAKLFTLESKHFLEAVEHVVDNHPFHETYIIGESNDESQQGEGEADQASPIAGRPDTEADRQEVWDQPVDDQ